MKVVICTCNPYLGLSCLELRSRQGEGIVGALCLILSFHKLNLQTFTPSIGLHQTLRIKAFPVSALEHIWSQTHDRISSDQWDVKQDVDERWSGREQTIDSQRRPLRGLLPFFTNKKLSYIIAPLFHWSLIFSLNCLNVEKVFCSGGTFCFCLHWQLSPQGTHASKLQ